MLRIRALHLPEIVYTDSKNKHRYKINTFLRSKSKTLKDYLAKKKKINNNIINYTSLVYSGNYELQSRFKKIRIRPRTYSVSLPKS